jgi:hypothetical protein
MAGPGIDHIVAVVLLIATLTLSFTVYNQILANAIAYERSNQVAMKAMDLMGTVCLTPGNPANWGQNNVTPTCFGLQDPDGAGYELSSSSLMRLLTSSGKVYYNRTGEWFSNISWGVNGGYLLMPTSDCINYAAVSRLLGTNGSYGFQLSVTPTLSVILSEVQQSPLNFSVEVEGSGPPLSGVALNYLMFWTVGNNTMGYPLLNFTSGSAITKSTGLCYLSFPQINVNNNQTAYTLIVEAYLGGLYSVGYISRETITGAGNIIPFVESFGNQTGTVLLAHKWGKNDPTSSQKLYFNATFYVLPDNFAPVNVVIPNSAGWVNGTGGKPFQRIQIPTSNAGFLVVAYCKGNQYGMVIMPWGIGTIGLSVTFGGNSSGYNWVATELRQVTVNEISYQVKLAVWSLRYR